MGGAASRVPMPSKVAQATAEHLLKGGNRNGKLLNGKTIPMASEENHGELPSGLVI